MCFPSAKINTVFNARVLQITQKETKLKGRLAHQYKIGLHKVEAYRPKGWKSH